MDWKTSNPNNQKIEKGSTRMKIAIVTFVRAYNYGAVLQCYALSKTLQKMGHEVEVIDYFPEYFKKDYSFAYLGKLRCFPPYRPIRNWIHFIPVKMAIDGRIKGFEKFLYEKIPLTMQTFHSFEEIDATKFDYDVFISGSDQVWSNVCTPFDQVYFLQFDGAKKRKRISYAASFGFSEVPADLKEEYARRLDGWDAYSVREKSGAQILHDLVKADATCCCDPTILLREEEWSIVARKPAINKPYILAYCVNSPKMVTKYAKELSEKHGLTVVYLSSCFRYEDMMGYEQREEGFLVKSTASPEEWIGYIKYAKYVITDSFHGTVFSCIFQKQFMTITTFEYGENGRAMEFLSNMSIDGHELPGNMDNIDKEINWRIVKDNFQKMIDEADRYLRDCLRK